MTRHCSRLAALLAALSLVGACTYRPSYSLGPPSGGDLVALQGQVAESPQSGPYPEVQYDYAGTNPETDPADDPLSTFSLDVDDASYAIARRYVRDGHLPDEDSVRVEEFVNHFRYGIPPPPSGEVNLLADGAPSPYAEGKHIVRVAVRAADVPAPLRRPVRLVAAVDCSGSMIGEDRIGLVKASLRTLLRNLQRGDQLGIVAFRNQQVTVLPLTRIRETEKILTAIDGLEAKLGTGTNVLDGIHAAARVAQAGLRTGFTAHVLLCTDGTEDGWGRVDRAWDQGGMGYYGTNVNLTPVGFGMGRYNDAALESVGSRHGGRYAYVGTTEESRRFFGNEFPRSLHTVAWNVRAQMAWSPATVKSYRLLGFENRARPDSDIAESPSDSNDVELGVGDEVTALYEVELKPGATGSLGRFTLRYETVTRKTHLVQMDIDRDVLAPSFQAAPPALRLAATVARFAEVLRKSPYAKASDLDRVRAELEQLPADTDQRGELPSLRALADRIETLRKKGGAS